MIPVRMRHEDVRINRHFLQQFLSELEYACATIKDDEVVVVGTDFNTGGVAAMANRAWAGYGDRTAHSPKTDFHT